MLLKTYLKTIDTPMKVFNPCSINEEIKSLSLLFNMQGISSPPLGKDIS
jgi:hypothetical protein